MHEDPLAWESVVWRQGDGRYVFEVAQGGLFACLRAPHGGELTLPMVAWDGLLDALTAARKTKERSERVGGGLPRRAGARWSAAEAADLAAAFRAGTSIETLAGEHNRSAYAIETKLADLGLHDGGARGGAGAHPRRERPMVPPDWPPDPRPDDAVRAGRGGAVAQGEVSGPAGQGLEQGAQGRLARDIDPGR